MPKYVPTRQTPETLANLATELRHQADLVQGVSEGMNTAGFPDLIVTNGDQRERGLEFIEKFVNAARAAIRKARENRCDFGSELPVGHKKGVSGRKKRSLKKPTQVAAGGVRLSQEHADIA